MVKNDNYNNWETGIYPFSWHQFGTTLWSGTDTEENFKKNGNHDYCSNVTYEWNKQGFRTYEFAQFTNKSINLALGCSHTEGVGLTVDDRWSSFVEKSTDLPLLNLGLGGGSSDTVARILTNVSTLFDIKTVYILWPPINRFELFLDWSVETVVPGSSSMEYVWNLDDVTSFQRYCKNKLIVDLLSKTFNFKVIHRANSDCFPFVTDYGRDNMHWGPETHESIGKSFLNDHIVC